MPATQIELAEAGSGDRSMITVTLGKLKTAETALSTLEEKGVQLDRVSVAMIHNASFFQEETQVSLDFVPVREPSARFWHGNRSVLTLYQIARKQRLSLSPSIEVGIMLALEHADLCQTDRTIALGMKSMPFRRLPSPFTDNQWRSHRAYDRVLSLMSNDRYVAHLGANELGVFLTGRGVEYIGENNDSWAFLKAA